jgi:hypothetical protein
VAALAEVLKMAGAKVAANSANAEVKASGRRKKLRLIFIFSP